MSGVVEMDLPGDATQLLTLATVVPEADPLQPLSNVPAALRDVYTAAKADIHPIDFASPALSSFWGRPIVLHGWVMTPPTMRRIPTNAIQNKNHGDVFTEGLHGKRFSLLIENEIWWRAVSLLSVGSEIRVSHDVSAIDGRLLIYPTVGIRYLF